MEQQKTPTGKERLSNSTNKEIKRAAGGVKGHQSALAATRPLQAEMDLTNNLQNCFGRLTLH